MLPAQDQGSQHNNMATTATFQPGLPSTGIPPSALTHRRRVSNVEGRPRKRQFPQEFQPYTTVAPGQISRHKKHRSQPVNFLDDPTLLMNSPGLSYTTTAANSAMMGRKFANFLQENRIPEGNVTNNLGTRQRSMSQVNLQQEFLQDVTGGITNTQDLSNPQLNQTVTPRALNGLNGMSFVPITPGSPFVGLIPQQVPAFSQQVSQQALSSQFVLSPDSARKPSKRPFPPLSTNIRSIPPPPDLVEKIKSHMRRHSVDTTPVVRNMDSYFVNMGSTSSLPSPPNSAPLVTTNAFDMAPMPSTGTAISHITVPEEEGNFEEGDDSSYFSPSGSSTGHSPGCPSSPQMQSIDSLIASEKLHHALQSAASRQGGDSVDSVQSSREFFEGDPDDETARVPGGFVRASGISNDEISAYISGPEPSDNKWVCLYPECQKRFGRKENIKSHVQTHLGDRQFRCEVCKKCFVRQHDLKRHAKIHTGIKPYPCKCGNSFARHDALTRHRQRGMCIGAFEGIVKKVVKRGRPKKIRAEGEPETPKKRRKNKKRPTEGGSSSGSGASISSGSDIGASSPSACDDIDNWDIPTSPVPRMLETVPEIAPNPPTVTGKRKRSISSELEDGEPEQTKREKLESIPMNSFAEFAPADFGLPPTSPLYSSPSSPGEILNAVSPTTTTDTTKQDKALGFCDPLLNSFDEDTSFTPEGSPDLQVLHRKYVSAFNTPEWEGLSAPAIAADQVDLREILGLPDLESSSAAATAASDAFPYLGNNKEINPDISLTNLNGLNSGFDLGLTEEFDLLQESDVLDMQLWQNLQGEY